MILKHRDRELLKFEWTANGVRIVAFDERLRRFLPPDFRDNPTDAALWTWLKRRVIPRNRRYVMNFLARAGLRSWDVRGIIALCRGLSLNDVHWVVEDDFSGKWSDCNLYDNEFSPALAFAAFTGGGQISSPEPSTSPEFTTNGMLAKCWRRIGGEVMLFKSGSEGAANAGFEPYSEYHAAQLAEALGLHHVEYGLAKFKGRLCSTCRLFTSDKVGFVPAARLCTTDAALRAPRFADIFLFDAVTLNTDRHLGNFGYLIDNDTNEITRAAPIFDNGYGLFSRAIYKNKYVDDFADLDRFAETLKPALYDDWLDLPAGVTDEMRDRLNRLSGFRFKRHTNYELPAGRLRAIEDFIQHRIAQITGNTGNAPNHPKNAMAK